MKPLQTITNEIREACIAANLEIVELKFGCVISYEKSGFKSRKRRVLAKLNGTRRGNQYLVWAYTPPHDAHVIDDGILSTCEKVKEEEIYKILGRDISLADVLLTLDSCEEDVAKNAMNLTKFNAMALVGKIVMMWDLRKDSLDNQEEATKRFIHSLLSK